MTFNTILININIDISNEHITTNTELTYGNDKFYYKHNSYNKKDDIILNLDKFIDESYYYKITYGTIY